MKEELEQMDLPGEEEQKELIHAWLVEKGGWRSSH